MNQLVKIRYFKTWMTRILINKCYDIRRKNQNIICLDECEEPAACDEYNLELKEALAALVENTVKTRLQRGREKLEVYYKEK